MSKTKRNTRLRNSHGISQHEFKLNTECACRSDREMYNDYDYLGKLSPNEIAWLAEFSSNMASGFKVRPHIVGEENAKKMNSPEMLRPAYRGKNSRQRNECYIHRFRSKDQSFLNDEEFACTEKLSHKSVDDYITAIENVEEEIDIYWTENKIYRT
jgi:hypothetical protein